MVENAQRPCEAVEGIPRFESGIPSEEFAKTRPQLHTIQINTGKRCNLACKHCHIEAGPLRAEVMPRNVLETCLKVIDVYPFETVDITGGAPEMNPDFEWFIDRLCSLGRHVIVRSNLAILAEPGYTHLPAKFADYGINVVASLPALTEREFDSQRGAGTYRTVIQVLQELNALGYGKGTGLKLDLAYNPRGAFLPPAQQAIAQEYKQHLDQQWGIVFDDLYTLTNNPIGRFGAWLERSGNMDEYMQTLASSFNASTCEGMMCRDQIMVDWTGRVYDCDFDLACDLPSSGIAGIGDLVSGIIPIRPIRFGQHCYACCAGAGSSCTGSTA